MFVPGWGADGFAGHCQVGGRFCTDPRCNSSAAATSVYGEECGVGNGEAEGRGNSQILSHLYGVCMELVWNLYGVCMEQHARNTQSTPSQRACNRRARRQAAQAGVVGSPTELAGTTPGGAEQLGAWRPGHYRGRGRVKRGKSQGGWMPMTDSRGCLRDCCPVWAGAGEGRLPRSRCRGQGSGIARCQPGRHRP